MNSIDQPASGSSAEGPGHDGGGVARVGQRGLVQRMRAAFRAAQEGGPALRGHRSGREHGPHLARAHDAARRDLRQPGDRGDLADQRQQARSRPGASSFTNVPRCAPAS